MAIEQEITCIVCPIGCKILIRSAENQFELLEGNKCKRGIDYARSEALDPRRMLTTSVLVKGGEWPLVSVKSSEPVPKAKVYSVLKEVKKVNVKAPVKLGQAIIKNVVKTGVDIVATKQVNKY